MVFASEFVFPNAEDAPAAAAQGAIDEQVALTIAPEFFTPEKGVAGGAAAMSRAAMPETTIHKEGHALSAENEVRFAEERLVPPPAGDAVGAEPLDHHEFRVAVAVRADAGHHGGTFGFGEDVGHGRQ